MDIKFPSLDMDKLGGLVNKLIENSMFVSMTPEEKREFLIQLVEALARGAAEGVARGAISRN